VAGGELQGRMKKMIPIEMNYPTASCGVSKEVNYNAASYGVLNPNGNKDTTKAGGKSEKKRLKPIL
jgi:hypothetical protein